MERTNNKNFIIFLVLTFVLLFGWIQLSTWLWPRKPKEPADKPDAAQVDKKAKEQSKEKLAEKPQSVPPPARASRTLTQIVLQAVRPQEILLGDDSFNLKAKLRSR